MGFIFMHFINIQEFAISILEIINMKKKS